MIRNGEEYLYDLRTDPGETSPLHADTAGPAFEPLRAALAVSLSMTRWSLP